MDGLIFIIIAIVTVVLDSRSTVSDSKIEETAYESVETRTTKLNESFYDDPSAFSTIINALGFPKGRE